MCCITKDCLDDWLSYETSKVVIIKDRKLGILNYLVILLITLYIIGTVIVGQRYMLIEQPTGSIRFSLQSPQTRNETLPAISSYSYCSESVDDCRLWDETLVVYPPPEQSAIFITTHITNTSKYLNNELHKYVQYGDYNSFYIANIENFTLLIDHSMYTSFLNANSKDINGYLFGQTASNNQFDIFTVGELLKAARINLDQISTADPERTKTLRNNGCVLIVNIEYSNTHSFDLNNLIYTYHVSMISDTKYKLNQPIYTKNSDHIVNWNRHGVRIIFQITGNIGKFDFQIFLVNVGSSIGLIAVSTFIINWVFIKHCTQCSRRYKDSVYSDVEKQDFIELQNFESSIKEEDDLDL